MAGSEQLHNWLQNKIYEHPDILGFDRHQIGIRSKEVALHYKGHPFVVPDVYFCLPGLHQYIEVKSGHSLTCYNKGMSQLEKILKWNVINGVPNHNAMMVMPATRGTPRYWIDILDNLEIYQAGDSWEKPTHAQMTYLE